MKTAISVPDDLFRLAEATARRLRVSRSELYAKAMAEFLKRLDGNAITERLNDVYSGRPAKVDAALHRAQLQSLVAPSQYTGDRCLSSKQTPSISAGFKPQS